jgi:hypothetical protein
MVGQYLYHVIRVTTDYHNGDGDYSEIKGIYWTVEEANEAARRDLTSEWGMDVFEEYREMKEEDDSEADDSDGYGSEDNDEQEEEGPIKIRAVFPEGEIMKVRVERIPAPPISTTNTLAQHLPIMLPVLPVKTVVSAAVQQTIPQKLWAIYSYSIKNHEKDYKNQEIPRHEDHIIYESLSHANEAANNLLMDSLGIQNGEGLEDQVKNGIKNLGSSVEPYCADIYEGSKDTYHIYIQVQPVQLYKEQTRKRAATNTSFPESSLRSDKRTRPIEQVVIDLTK